MKTLIINGSPKKNGDTMALITAFQRELRGEVMLLDAESGIAPCLDCRYCWENPGCCLQDEMQRVYPYLEACNNIVLASPIWFSSLSGPLLNICSRIQTLFCAQYFRGEKPAEKKKHGVILLAGGEPGTEKQPIQTALTILKFMQVERPGVTVVKSMNTNKLPAAKDQAALASAAEAARECNMLYEQRQIST